MPYNLVSLLAKNKNLLSPSGVYPEPEPQRAEISGRSRSKSGKKVSAPAPGPTLIPRGFIFIYQENIIWMKHSLLSW
jgi:hypothetical protein